MTKPQLKMNWPESRLDTPPRPKISEGYSIRQCTPDDEPAFLQLMHDCGWPDWGPERMAYCKSRVLPQGWFLVHASGSDRLVASAMSLHNYSGKSPQSGTLGWVASHPDVRGQGLGCAVVASATLRLVLAGYRDIELYTEYFRAPALRLYLNLGYVPYLYNDAVTELWQELCVDLDWPFTPSQWPAGNNAFPSS